MSLSHLQQALPNVYTPSPNIPLKAPSSDCQTGCCGPNLSIPLPQSNSNIRGELTGDNCFTIYLGEDNMSGSIFNEVNMSSLSLQQSKIQSTIGITEQAKQELLEEKDLNEIISNVIFGKVKESSKDKNIDILYPIQHLGILDDNPIQLTQSSSPSSSSSSLKIEKEEILALIIQYWGEICLLNNKSLTKQGDIKKSKKTRKQKQVTFVIPGYFAMKQRKKLVIAAKLVGYDVRNIFSRSLAAVSASLINSNSKLLTISHKWIKNNSNNVDPIVLYVHEDIHGIEVSFICCERPRVELDVNQMYFDRLICLSTEGRLFSNFKEEVENRNKDQHKQETIDKKSLISQLVYDYLTSSLINVTSIMAVLYSGKEINGNEIFNLIEQKQDLKVKLSQLPFIFIDEVDIARGGATLSAAELESNKHYIDLEDESSTLAYSLSIGEDVVNYDIGYQIAYGPSSNDLNDESIIIKKGSPIYKRYLGPVVKHRNNTYELLVKPFTIEGGSVNSMGTFYPKYPPGYPKFTIVQRLPLNITNDNTNEIWVPLMDSVEILKNNIEEESSLYLKSTISFSINESIGIIRIENSQQDLVKEKSETKGQIFRVIATILLIILLVVGWYLYSIYQKNYIHQQNVEWLTDFYAKNAPQKLTESNFIEKTLQKYESNMFLLWRQLLKTYKVKWDPPSSILENIDDYKLDF